MNSQFLRYLLASALVVGTGSVVAIGVIQRAPTGKLEPEQQVWLQRQQVERKSGGHIKDKQGRGLYYLHFSDAPLASYGGEQKGLSATSLRASKGKNSRSDGLLDVKSSTSRQYLDWLGQRQQQILSAAREKIGKSLDIQRRYSVVMNAAVAALSDADVGKLSGVAGIRKVEPIRYQRIHTDAGPRFVGAATVWPGIAGVSAPSQGEGVLVGIMDTGIRPDHPAFADIGADGYDHQNPRGAGNYLGDCVANTSLCNDKLVGIVSFEDITYEYAVTPDKNGNFREANGIDYNGHGTHVAATVAGNVVTDVPIFNVLGDQADIHFPEVSGVAPHANIVAYQVCTWYGQCLPHLAVASVEHAIANGVKVLNYSVGGGAYDPWQGYGEAEAFLNAREAGIHIATSAGNRGPGEGTVSSPGNLPWVTSVAAYTHDRGVSGKTLSYIAGGTTSFAVMSGSGISGAVQGRVVDAHSFGDGRCLAPFAPGTFDGAIVVCRRGDVARVEKGRNVKAGGAAGLILINVDTNANNLEHDPQPLPSIQLDVANGEALLQWLASGSNHEVTISAGTFAAEPARGDIAGYFSSRGPVLPSANYLAPSVAAPGVAVYAAWIEDAAFDANASELPYAFLDGTSMASPNVAGALALMVATRPTWTPAEAQSALMSTAWSGTRNHLGQASTHFDHGAGRIRVDKAIRAGLLFDESAANYRAANPAPLDGGPAGEPAQLNLASLTWRDCILDCVWTRRVKATAAATWTASTRRLSPGLEVSVVPSQFSLTAGEEIQLTVTASSTSLLAGNWMEGELVLSPSNSTLAETVLPVTASFRAGQMPSEQEVIVQRNAGTTTIAGIRSVATDELHVETAGVVRAVRHVGLTTGDDTLWSLFDNLNNWQFVPLSLDSDSEALIATISSAEATDLDLYLVRDMNVNGRIEAEEFYQTAPPTCISAGPTAEERCFVMQPSPGVYVLGVHNYQGSAAGAVDRHELEVAVVRNDGTPTLTATPPASVPARTPWSLPVSWNAANMQPGEKWFGVVRLGTTSAQPGNIGELLLTLTRGSNDVMLVPAAAEVSVGEPLVYELSIAANPESSARSYRLELPMPAPLSLLAADGNPEIEGSVLRWNAEIPAGSAGVQWTVQFGTEAVEGYGQFAPVLKHQLGDGDMLESTTPEVLVRGHPVAKINNESETSITVTENQNVTIRTTGSRGAAPDEALEYEWQQVAGPATPMQALDNGDFALRAPVVGSETVLRYQLRVSNGSQTSEPALLTVTVTKEAGGSGGGGSMPAAVLLLLPAVFWRRRLRN